MKLIEVTSLDRTPCFLNPMHVTSVFVGHVKDADGVMLHPTAIDVNGKLYFVSEPPEVVAAMVSGELDHDEGWMDRA